MCLQDMGSGGGSELIRLMLETRIWVHLKRLGEKGWGGVGWARRREEEARSWASGVLTSAGPRAASLSRALLYSLCPRLCARRPCLEAGVRELPPWGVWPARASREGRSLPPGLSSPGSAGLRHADPLPGHAPEVGGEAGGSSAEL